MNAKVDSGVDQGSTLPFVAEQQAMLGMDFLPNDAGNCVGLSICRPTLYDHDIDIMQQNRAMV